MIRNHGRDFCSEYWATGPHGNSSDRKCFFGAVRSSDGNDFVVFAVDEMVAGDWTLSVESGPGVATFKLDVEASQVPGSGEQSATTPAEGGERGEGGP